MRTIDLRSDTFTLPTKEMIESISKAELGDDVEKEDPTVNELEEMAAKRFGTENAMLVASGTMGNLVAMMTHCGRGDEIVLEAESHIYYYELGGMSSLVGAIPMLIDGRGGKFTAKDLRAAVRPQDLHYPITRLVCLENTHNRAGGTVWTPSEIKEVADTAHEMGLKVHIDGARIFNAAVALDVPVSEFTKHVDSISFCLSKGLCCPVGSVLVGSKDFIARARRNRKMVGGGMRQAGIIAAPGIVALSTMVDRLREDHQNAKRLAGMLNDIPKLKVDVGSIQTNIVLVDISATRMDAEEFARRCDKIGVRIFEFGTRKVRFVTHHGIESEDIDETVRRVTRLLR